MSAKLIHMGKLMGKTLYLKEIKPNYFAWMDEEGEEMCSAPHVEEAIRLAQRLEGFRTLNCGFCYTLPERDEHGGNALFHQMAASYSSATGTYFDQELGHNCVVHNASKEALDLWRKFDGKLD